MTTPTIPFYPVTHDDGTNIVEALNNLVSAKRMPYVVADGFSTSVSYNVEDYVIYENNLYRFTAPHAAGPWDSSQAIRVTIGDQFKTLGIEKINNNAVAPVFKTDTNYSVGDVVSYKGDLYRFMFQHTAGEWDRTQVIQTNAISEGGGGGSGGSSIGDEINFDGDNMIITSSERSIDSLESSIAIIATGDTHISISTGQYVYVKGHEDLNEGLYIASSDIAENGTLSSSNLNDVSGGGLNSLKNNINAIDSSLAIVSDSDTHVAIASGQYVYVKNHSTLTEGLYTANSAIGANVALTTSNLTSVISNGGGLNNLKQSIDSFPKNIVEVWGNTSKTINTNRGNPSGALVFGYYTIVFFYWINQSSGITRVVITGDSEGNRLTVNNRTITFTDDPNRQYTVILPYGAWLS